MTQQEIFEKLMKLRSEIISSQEHDEQANAIFWDVGKALGLTENQCGQLAGDNEIGVKQPETIVKLNPGDYEITDGYVGSLGKTYETATEKTLQDAVTAAAKRYNKTETEIMQMLAGGKQVDWCNSPNFYYDHGTGIIRRKRNLPPIQLTECDCGHSVPAGQVMTTSQGTSCPDCYDRMSN